MIQKVFRPEITNGIHVIFFISYMQMTKNDEDACYVFLLLKK